LIPAAARRARRPEKRNDQALSLRDSAIAGRYDEGGKLTVGNQIRVDEKAVDTHPRYRSFLRVMAVGSRLKHTAGDPDHVLGLQNITSQ
jgi:hypothetical protein